MKLLLDTHIILWALDDNPKLPSQIDKYKRIVEMKEKCYICREFE